MEKDVKKVNLLPISEQSEVAWLIKKIELELKDVIPILDSVGKQYEHDVPWSDRFLADHKAYLKRVLIGAVGRINTSADAIKLGVMFKTPAKSAHFTSMGLYNVFRIARQRRREVMYIKDLQKWVNSYLSGKAAPHMFINYARDGYYA
jgi:hypothetical protein